VRVNVDSQALTDPRIRRIGKRLGISRWDALGRLIAVWHNCYDRRASIVSTEDVDECVELDGFAVAMVECDLADPPERISNAAEIGLSRGLIYVRGVTDRIRFLDEQKAKGRASGEARRKSSVEYETARRVVQTTLEHRFAGGSTEQRTHVQPPVQPDSEPPKNVGSTETRTYSLALSPDLALSLAPDLAPDQKNPPDSGPTTQVIHSSVDNSGIASVSSQSNDSQNPLSDSRTVVIVQPAPSQRPFRETKAVRPKKEAPEQATVSAFLLIEAICRNHPESKLARASDRDKEIRAADWADTFRLMDERDKITYPEIQGMVFWVQGHNFWSQQILSANALRNHWDKLVAQRRGRSEPKSGGTLKALYDHVQDMEEKEKAGAG
jgi:hypothetical protein